MAAPPRGSRSCFAVCREPLCKHSHRPRRKNSQLAPATSRFWFCGCFLLPGSYIGRPHRRPILPAWRQVPLQCLKSPPLCVGRSHAGPDSRPRASPPHVIVHRRGELALLPGKGASVHEWRARLLGQSCTERPDRIRSRNTCLRCTNYWRGREEKRAQSRRKAHHRMKRCLSARRGTGRCHPTAPVEVRGGASIMHRWHKIARSQEKDPSVFGRATATPAVGPQNKCMYPKIGIFPN